jgi:hypothetical protein
MTLSHFAILKAKPGEGDALVNLDQRTASHVWPLFEVERLTERRLANVKFLRESPTPIITHIDKLLDDMSACWIGRTALVDGYDWAPNATVETGQHAIAYMVSSLRQGGVFVIPVVGYDRWENEEYRRGIESIPHARSERYCVRFDSAALEDSAEPDVFEERTKDILDGLRLDPRRCLALIDFGDVSSDGMSIERLTNTATRIVEMLAKLGFAEFVVAGCSLPKSIDLAVGKRDSEASVLRKENILWRSLRISFPDLAIVSGDYGVRGPNTTDVPTKHANGKLRHTYKTQFFVTRGHSISDGDGLAQMATLALKVMGSEHYLGSAFSWGDLQIKVCGEGGRTRDLSYWIAVDTNHHLTFVVQEVEEFERELVASRAVRDLATIE